MTLRQVLEALSSLRNSSRVEAQISRAGGVQFEASPAVVDILKQFGASAKLISMIPLPPPAPEPPAPTLAGPLTIICEPKDCAIAIDQKYVGPTNENRKTITGLSPGDATIEIFVDGYEHLTRQIRLEPNQAKEEKFSLRRNPAILQQSASASLLKAVAGLGGPDGLAELGDIEGSGTMQWMNSAGQVDEWMMTFNKRIGRNLAVTFKTKDGECVASVIGATSKQECKSGLRNGGDKIAEQGSSLFLSYQLQDIIQALLMRPLISAESNENLLESSDTKDAYVLTLGNDGLPTDLIYRIGDDAPIHVEYSNYMNLNRARYPGRIAIGRMNSLPVWIFTLNNVRSRVGR